MDEIDKGLTDHEMHNVSLESGCAIAGVMLGGVPCWFAWGPFGLYLRVFSSYWDAMGAIAYAMRKRWITLDADKLRELDAQSFSLAAGVDIRAVKLGVNSSSLRGLRITNGRHQIRLIEILGDRLCLSLLKTEREMEEFAAYLDQTFSSDPQP